MLLPSVFRPGFASPLLGRPLMAARSDTERKFVLSELLEGFRGLHIYFYFMERTSTFKP